MFSEKKKILLLISTLVYMIIAFKYIFEFHQYIFFTNENLCFIVYIILTKNHTGVIIVWIDVLLQICLFKKKKIIAIYWRKIHDRELLRGRD